jgi:transposase
MNGMFALEGQPFQRVILIDLPRRNGAPTDDHSRLGPGASAMVASVQDISAFSGPREFAAFLGLTPRQNSSGGKERLGRVSKTKR